MSTPNFRFKRFTVWHDQCAMKVGTDGVLLGAWCPIAYNATDNNPYSILDIGTGSGLIALMLAQRTEMLPNCSIMAIDIDCGAHLQATDNFQASPWSERLESRLCALQDVEGFQQFDLIVSNPPFFQNSLKNPDKGRQMARHTDSLSYEELIAHSKRLLKTEGTLALVLPAEVEKDIIDICSKNGLRLTHLTRVHTKPGKPAKRILAAFQPTTHKTTVLPVKEDGDVLYIESEDSPRSKEYAALTQDFYL